MGKKYKNSMDMNIPDNLKDKERWFGLFKVKVEDIKIDDKRLLDWDNFDEIVLDNENYLIIGKEKLSQKMLDGEEVIEVWLPVMKKKKKFDEGMNTEMKEKWKKFEKRVIETLSIQFQNYINGKLGISEYNNSVALVYDSYFSIFHIRKFCKELSPVIKEIEECFTDIFSIGGLFEKRISKKVEGVPYILEKTKKKEIDDYLLKIGEVIKRYIDELKGKETRDLKDFFNKYDRLLMKTYLNNGLELKIENIIIMKNIISQLNERYKKWL